MHLLFFLTTLFYILTEGALYKETQEDEFLLNDPETQSSDVYIDLGTNYTLPCGQQQRPGEITSWSIKAYLRNTHVLQNGSLFFNSIQEKNSGLYSCHLEIVDEDDNKNFVRPKGKFRNSTLTKRVNSPKSKYVNNPTTLFHVKVRTPPLKLKNVTVLASTILASVIWEKGDDGGYPISGFHIRYRLINESKEEEEWINCQPDNISPSTTHIDIFNLLPNSTYLFEAWANNHLGKGVSTPVTVFTHNDIQEIEVGKYLLEGVDTFDTRAWLVAVSVVLGTLIVLGIASCCLFYKEYYSINSWTSALETRRRQQGRGVDFGTDGEDIELIINPVYESTEAGDEISVSNTISTTNNTSTRLNSHSRNNSTVLTIPTRV